jgi:Ca-activated chloride channel homolog
MQADFLLDYDVITVEREQKLYLMARLLAGPAPQDTSRRPLNLSLVIDRSGSMAGNKIDYTRQAAKLLVQNMSANDTLSIVLYNESVETLLPPQQVQHKDTISQRIDQIKAGGTTNLSGGWLEGVEHVAANIVAANMNRVILMSDGLANRGVTTQERLVEIAQQKKESGVSTTTMGLGEDFNEDLLIAMADGGGGAFYFIESPEVTPSIFQEELKGLLSVIGQNLVITVETSAHVTDVHQLNAFPQEERPHGTAFRMGDVFGDEVKTLMLELTIPAMKDIGQLVIATLHFEYDELRDGKSERQRMSKPVTINITSGQIEEGQRNHEVMRSMLLLRAAEARREAIKLADKGRYAEASKLLRDAADEIREANLDDPALQEERGALVGQAKDMDRGAEYYQSYSRKSMSTQAYFTGRGVHESTQALRLREKERKKEPGSKTGGSGSNVQETNSSKKTGFFENLMPPENVPPSPVTEKTATPPTQLRWNDQTYPLDKDLIRIGRAPQNEVIIDTAGMSRFHAQIQRSGNGWVLEDLGSTNGTHVAGRSLDKPYTLRSGDVVYFCDQRVVFEA